ncbi:MAG: DUF86 domain-containing protein [Chitinispirillales bacterium]|jgi:uncharacterized protein with HEPN domain|nr:DUF86 domain-containing protein [Chitinispirillales bacterium]
MSDNTLIIELLEQVERLIESLLEAVSQIENISELPESPDGMLRLNGICMSFIVIGEEVKRIDRYTESQLLPNYPLIPWKRVMGMRDRMVHGYFQIDIEVVFDALKNDIPPLLAVIKQMKDDLSP